jgi:hypothetical protein
MKLPDENAGGRCDPLEQFIADIAARYEGREMLRRTEVCAAISISNSHLQDLIEEHAQTAGKSGIGAVNVASGKSSGKNQRGNKSARTCWRIPLQEFVRFLRRAAHV